jgi:hypothetical protein
MNSKAHKQTVEMCLHRPPRHIKLLGNFVIVAALQKQFYDLPLPWP